MLAYKVPYTEIMYNTKHIAYCKCKTNTNNYLVIVFTNILDRGCKITHTIPNNWPQPMHGQIPYRINKMLKNTSTIFGIQG